MAKSIVEQFVERNERTLIDASYNATLRNHLGEKGPETPTNNARFANLDNTRKKAHLIKWRATENLERYLLNFESNFTRHGGQVVWANDLAEAHDEIAKILERHKLSAIARSHDMILDEIEVDTFSVENDVGLTITDFARHVTQLRQEKPTHFENSAIHLSEEDILAELPDDEEGASHPDPEKTKERKLYHLRQTIRKSLEGVPYATISGADFLIADTGSIATHDNEENIRYACSKAAVHIVVAGIDAVIPSLYDLDYLWPSYTAHIGDDRLCTNLTLWNGPRKQVEVDGPQTMYVILLDNGRSTLLAKPEQRQGLYCLKCGTCLEACGYFQQVGASNYQTPYFGPIGALIMPHLDTTNSYPHLSHASSLRHDAKEICPTRIDLERLLALNRRDEVVETQKPKPDKTLWGRFTWFIRNRKRINFFGIKWQNYLLKRYLVKYWGNRKAFPKIQQKSFAQQWVAKQKTKNE